MSSASRSVAWERITPTATLLLLSLLAAAPLWGPGLLNTRGGGDSPFLLLRTHQLAVNLRAGEFPARWMPDAAYGFGYPFFSYYAALPYYIAAGFEILGLDILTAIKLTQTLFLAASALTMYRWAEQVLHNRPGAWLAAVAYLSAPFHLVNLYVRGDSLSEFAAFAFYPLILWGFDRLASQPSIRRAVVPALAYAGLIVTHNASALIFSPFILLYLAFRIGRSTILGPDRSLRKVAARGSLFIATLLLALLLSAWFWLPALAETDYVQLTAQTSGYFFYANHFRGSDLVQRSLFFDYTTGQNANSPFAMGLIQASLALSGLFIASFGVIRSPRVSRASTSETSSHKPYRRHLDTLEVGFALLGFLLTTWLITPLSRSVWDHVPLLPMVQFPWRFLSIQALFAALLIGATVSRTLARQGRVAWAAALVLGAALTTTALFGLRPSYLAIGANDVNPERLRLYELFTGNVGSTIRHEYLPRWVKPRPYIGPDQLSPDAPPRAIPVSGDLLRAERLDRKPTRRLWHVETGTEGAEVAFPLYYWPGWRASVDGRRQEVQPAVGSGYLSMDVPPGSHAVDIRLGRTPLRLGAEVASLVVALMLLTICAVEWNQRRRNEGAEDPGRAKQTDSGSLTSRIPHSQTAIPYLFFIGVLCAVIVFQPRLVSTASDDLTMDFEEMPYLHHNPDGVCFDGWRLLRYGYGTPESGTVDTTTAGRPLSVVLDWRTDNRPAADTSSVAQTRFRLVSPAAIRHDEAMSVAEAAVGFAQPQAASGITHRTRLNLSIPSETAPGIYLLQIDDAHPVYLRPIWIVKDRVSTEEPVRATFAEGALRLHDLKTTQSTPERLRVRIDWSAVKPVAANYGLSLRLFDIAGNEWLLQGNESGYDTQPGRGFLPTSLWPLDRIINDHHLPAIRPGAPPGDTYTLTVELYRVATWESVGQYTETVALTQTARPPDASTLAQLGDELALSRLETPQSIRQGERLEVTAFWSTVKIPKENYVVEWRLQRGDRSIVKAQPLAAGSTPSEWPVGAWIAGRTALPIPPTSPPGDYTLSITLNEPGRGAQIGSYTHPIPITIREQERAWELPPMDENVGARFGGMIELAGYDVQQGRDSLHLTLYWQALTTPDRHYMVFVHLADPATGEPASQVDTMPRAFGYPTGQWAPGEVISDSIELPTKDVAAGRYDLAVGWYDPDTEQRLQAVDRQGVPLSDDRVILPTIVTIP